MTDNHPITPPPELVRQCWDELRYQTQVLGAAKAWDKATAIAYQAGADQELEACLKWMGSFCATWTCGRRPEDVLRSARRPKPPSLKEQALGLLNEGPVSDLLDHEVDTIRRAIEALPDS